MLYYTVTWTVLSVFLLRVDAGAVLSPLAPVQTPHACLLESVVTTPPPKLRGAGELRKRQRSSAASSSSIPASSSTHPNKAICGYSTTGTGSLWCLSQEACSATIYGDGKAYAYCALSGRNDPVETVGYNHWDPKRSCPSGTQCCSSPYAFVYTYLFTASGYSATLLECTSEPLPVETLIAGTNLIDPRGFSASLAKATASSSTTPPSPTNAGSGLSSGAKIGIGAGVGARVGLLLLGAVIFLCFRHKKKKERRLAEIQPSQAQYSRPMSDMHAQPQYYQTQQSSPLWSPHPPASPYPQYSPQPAYSDQGFTAATGYEKDKAVATNPQELHGQHTIRDY